MTCPTVTEMKRPRASNLKASRRYSGRKQKRQNRSSGPSSSDYNLLEPRLLLVTYHFGDAPEPYPVTLADHPDVARHGTGTDSYGSTSDGEHTDYADGKSPPFFAASIVSPGGKGFVSDPLSLDNHRFDWDPNEDYYVDGWVDWNQDGDWLDSGEQIFDRVRYNPTLGWRGFGGGDFPVPDNAALGGTFGRFRISSSGDLEPHTGSAADGLMDDVFFHVVQPDYENPDSHGFAGLGELNWGDWFEYRGSYGDPGPKLADFNQDGATDVVINGAFAPYSNGTMQPTKFLEVVWRPSKYSKVGDINGDGIVDMVENDWVTNVNGNGYDAQIAAVSSLDGSTVDGWVDIISPRIGNGEFGIVDYDADGRDDLIAETVNSQQEPDGIYWLRGQTDFSLTSPKPADPVFQAAPHAQADIDGDGDADLISREAVYLRSSGTNFIRIPLASAFGWASEIFTTDLDQDDHREVVGVNGSNLVIQEFTGAGLTTVYTRTTRGGSSLIVTDVDNDSYDEIIVDGTGNQQISVLQFDGNFTANVQTYNHPDSDLVVRVIGSGEVGRNWTTEYPTGTDFIAIPIQTISPTEYIFPIMGALFYDATRAPENNLPTLDPIADRTIDEDAAEQTVNLTGITAGGSDEQTLRVTASSNNTGLIPQPSISYNSPNSTGQLWFTPLADQYGSAIITVTVEDAGNDNDLNTSGDNLTYSRTFTVTVNPVNDAPLLDPISDVVIDEDSSQQSIDLTGIDAGGGESQNLRVTARSYYTSLIPTPTVDYNTPNSTGTVRFTPRPNQFGTTILTVTVEDGGDDNDLNTSGDNLTYTRSFAVTVNPVNDTPLLDPISDVVIDEDAGEQTIDLTGIDAGGEESQNLRVMASSNNTNLIPTPTVDYNTPNSTGTVRFRPLPNQFGSAIITVTVEDAGNDNDLNTPGDNLTYSRTFTLTVNPVNDAPLLDPISDVVIDEDSSQQSIDLTGIDAGGGESQNLRVTARSYYTSLIPTPTVDYNTPNSTGTVRFTPRPNQFGTTILTVTVEDGGDDNDLNTSGDNLTYTRSFAVTVNPVNDTPLLDPISDVVIDEDAGEQTIDLTGIDAGGEESQNLRVMASSNNTNLIPTPTVDYNTPNSTGTVRFRPLPNQFGSAIITVTVEDAGNDNDLNTPGDNLTYSRTFTLTVNPVNDAPLLDPISDVVIDEDSSQQSIDLTGIDAGGGESQNLRVTARSYYTSLIPTPTVDYNTPNSTGTVRFTPRPNQFGTTILTVTVEDGGDDNDLNTSGDNLTYTRSFAVTVNPVNDTPLLDPISDVVIDEDAGEQTIDLTGIDAGGEESQNLRVMASSNNTNLIPTPTVDYNTPNSTGTVRFRPLPNQFGSAIITVTVEDAGNDNDLNTPGDNLTYSRTFTLTVNPVNDAPLLDPIDDVTIHQDASQQSISVTGIDAGGGETQNLRVTAKSQNTDLIPTPTVDYTSPNETGNIYFTPLPDQSGTAVITVTVEDGGDDNDLGTTDDNLTTSRTFMVTVQEVNELGPVDYFRDEGVTVDGERWYQGSTSQTGLLTMLAQFDADSSNGELEIELLDAQKQLIATATPVASGLRLDYTADVGETFYLKLIGDQTDIDLRILNLVKAVGDTVTVAGTDSTDDYSLTAGANHRLVVHGIDYTFSGDDYNAFNIDGAAGADSIWIGGTSGRRIDRIAFGRYSNNWGRLYGPGLEY